MILKKKISVYRTLLIELHHVSSNDSSTTQSDKNVNDNNCLCHLKPKICSFMGHYGVP